jgi:hypothetical protein
VLKFKNKFQRQKVKVWHAAGAAVFEALRYTRKVAGSIPDGVTGFFFH